MHPAFRKKPLAVARSKRAGDARRWVTVFALLAFFLQGLVVQSHIHPLIQPVVAKAASQPAPAPLKNQDPVDHCRLCQEMVHAGTFVTPSSVLLVADLTFVAAIFAASPALAGASAKAFAWQSRAPPRR
jgi:hypothetical protein